MDAETEQLNKLLDRFEYEAANALPKGDEQPCFKTISEIKQLVAQSMGRVLNSKRLNAWIATPGVRDLIVKHSKQTNPELH